MGMGRGTGEGNGGFTESSDLVASIKTFGLQVGSSGYSSSGHVLHHSRIFSMPMYGRRQKQRNYSCFGSITLNE